MKTIATEAALKHVLALRNGYAGPDREEYVAVLDRLINSVRERFGSQIPLTEALALLKELEARVGRVD